MLFRKSARFNEISVNVWSISTWDLQTTYFCKWRACDLSYRFASQLFLIRSSHLCVALAEYRSQLFKCFLLSVFFVFCVTLFLKRMEIILSASKLHYHFRLSKPILKIQSIYRKNILGKQFSQAISDCFMHQNFKYFLQN